MPPVHFVVFIVVSFVVFVAILRWTLRSRTVFPSLSLTAGIAFIVVVVGMIFAKFGANQGFGWPIYYGAPALTTLVLPPAVFHMRPSEFFQYLALAFASSPTIHFLFSFFVGWPEYLPFWHIQPFWQL